MISAVLVKIINMTYNFYQLLSNYHDHNIEKELIIGFKSPQKRGISLIYPRHSNSHRVVHRPSGVCSNDEKLSAKILFTRTVRSKYFNWVG